MYIPYYKKEVTVYQPTVGSITFDEDGVFRLARSSVRDPNDRSTRGSYSHRPVLVVLIHGASFNGSGKNEDARWISDHAIPAIRRAYGNGNGDL